MLPTIETPFSCDDFLRGLPTSANISFRDILGGELSERAQDPATPILSFKEIESEETSLEPDYWAVLDYMDEEADMRLKSLPSLASKSDSLAFLIL